MGISTHILDTTIGKPASGVRVTLEAQSASGWYQLGEGTTDADGRVKALLGDTPARGTYRLTFHVAPYFAACDVAAFYPEVSVTFLVPEDGQPHYHVPLLLNPFGFSTYRGS